MSKKKYCCADNYSVIIPYRDLEKMLEIVNKMEHFQKQLSHINDQLSALRYMHTEVLEKVAEIDRYL